MKGLIGNNKIRLHFHRKASKLSRACFRGRATLSLCSLYRLYIGGYAVEIAFQATLEDKENDHGETSTVKRQRKDPRGAKRRSMARQGRRCKVRESWFPSVAEFCCQIPRGAHAVRSTHCTRVLELVLEPFNGPIGTVGFLWFRPMAAWDQGRSVRHMFPVLRVRTLHDDNHWANTLDGGERTNRKGETKRWNWTREKFDRVEGVVAVSFETLSRGREILITCNVQSHVAARGSQKFALLFFTTALHSFREHGRDAWFNPCHLNRQRYCRTRTIAQWFSIKIW